MNMPQNLSVLGRRVKLGQWGKINGPLQRDVKDWWLK